MDAYQDIWTNISETEWREIINNSTNFSEIARKVGRAPGGQFNLKLKEYACAHNISLEKFNTSNTHGKEKYTLEEILIQNSPVTRKVLRDYLAKHHVLDYKCAICGNIGEWNGVSLTLQLDHINGINNDNRKENLRWLCPNCHSQTDTYTGKNKTKKEVVNFTEKEAIEALKQTENINQASKLIGCAQGGANWIRLNNIKKENNIIQSGDLKKQERQEFKNNYHKISTRIKKQFFCKQCGRPLSTNTDYCQTCVHEFQRKCEWPTREELKALIRTTPFLQIGKKYNVSDNAVRKWCTHYGLPFKKKDIKNISDEEWMNI